MGFWEQHEQARREAAIRARHPQDAPALCLTCQSEQPDTLLGVCGPCFDSWEANRV